MGTLILEQEVAVACTPMTYASQLRELVVSAHQAEESYHQSMMRSGQIGPDLLSSSTVTLVFFISIVNTFIARLRTLSCQRRPSYRHLRRRRISLTEIQQ